MATSEVDPDVLWLAVVLSERLDEACRADAEYMVSVTFGLESGESKGLIQETRRVVQRQKFLTRTW